MPRARFTATDEQRKLVEMLAAMGTPQEDIRQLILNPENGRPIEGKTLRREFRYQLDTAELRANAKVGGTLFAMATSGENVAATIFWLKTRAKWRETADVNVTHYKGIEEDVARAAGLTQRLVAKLGRESTGGA